MSPTEISHSDVSRPDVGVVAGKKLRFADETARLLRGRLKAVSLVLTVVLAAAFVGNLFSNNVPLIGLRTVVLLVPLISLLVLRLDRQFSLIELRVLEVAIFGAIAVQLQLMMLFLMAGFAEEGDATSTVAGKHLFLSAWSLVIFIYGIFMPNSWKRAAAVMLFLAAIPYATLILLQLQNQSVATALAVDEMGSALPLPVVAALVATFGTHVINSVRRREYQARQFGQYHLKEKLGVGGMGEVYQAEHRMLKRPCAIKLIRGDSEADTAAIERFEVEVRATAKLSHWNTVEIFDYGRTDDGTFYYVMELLPGMSLEELVERHGALPPGRAVHLLRQTCRGLREAHAVGLIHRDIKPANIFAASRGGVYDVAKLLDFGLVRQTTTNVDRRGAASAGFSGSPLYMAPEQATDYEQADARSDIYALGAVGYYLLTGKPPFQGENLFQILRAHAFNDVVPPSEVDADIPSDLEQILLRCLAKKPDDRFPDAVSLEMALASCVCADEWSDDKAQQWWQQVAPETGDDSSEGPFTAPVEKTIQIIGETVDLDAIRKNDDDTD